jgi:hypothetical protein
MSTATEPRTHCPTCGAKLHRTDQSLCAYCATPLSIADRPARVDDETIRRLKRLREHASFGAAMAFTPPDLETEHARARLLLAGTVAFLLAILPALAAAWLAVQGGAWKPAGALAAASLAAGLACLARRAALRRRALAQTLLRRPGLVVLRRSETDERSGRVTYFFTLRFDDGSEGEFRWPGQGTAYEPLSNGFTGIAYTRGADLVDFRRIT